MKVEKCSIMSNKENEEAQPFIRERPRNEGPVRRRYIT